eukprot:7670365-Pyramimonas_sp.AAC.1
MSMSFPSRTFHRLCEGGSSLISVWLGLASGAAVKSRAPSNSSTLKLGCPLLVCPSSRPCKASFRNVI